MKVTVENSSRWHSRLAILFFVAGWLAAPARADLRIAVPQADLGEIRAGVRLTHSFELQNDGPEPIEIRDIRIGCGCLKPRAEPRLLLPNAKGALFLQVNTLGQGAGPHAWTATLHYRRGDTDGEKTVRISANLITEVTVQPAALTLVGEKEMSQLVTLTDLRSEPLTITGVETSSPALKARLLGQAKDSQGRWVGQIQLEATADFSPGRHDEILSIHANDPVYAQLQVPVTIIKAASRVISATPVEVVLRGKANLSCLVRIRSTIDQPVRIEKVTADEPALSCKWASGPGNEATVRIQLEHGRAATLNCAIHIYVTGPAPETMILPVRYIPD